MEQLGTEMENLGIGLVPVFWGFMVAISEFIGGACLIFGLFFRPACILLTVTMTVIAISHLSEGKGLREASHAIETGILCLSFILIGAGKYSLDENLHPPHDKESL